MAVFPSSLKFNGTYRPYQKRILEKVPLLLSQKKLHLVAAPGSGKTTLGIELIFKWNELKSEALQEAQILEIPIPK